MLSSQPMLNAPVIQIKQNKTGQQITHSGFGISGREQVEPSFALVKAKTVETAVHVHGCCTTCWLCVCVCVCTCSRLLYYMLIVCVCVCVHVHGCCTTCWLCVCVYMFTAAVHADYVCVCVNVHGCCTTCWLCVCVCVHVYGYCTTCWLCVCVCVYMFTAAVLHADCWVLHADCCIPGSRLIQTLQVCVRLSINFWHWLILFHQPIAISQSLGL